MPENKKFNKLLAGILIFTLTFANFAFVSKHSVTYAMGFIGDLADEIGSETGHKNVEFDAYFETEGENSHSVISDVNNSEISISLSLGVKKAGYLKDAKVEFKTKDENQTLNYGVKGEIETNEFVQGFEENVLSLKQINASEENVVLNIPIEYVQEEYIDLSKLSQVNVVVITGTYINDDGKKVEINKEVELNVKWKDESMPTIESTVEKYIPFKTEEKTGVILQNLVKVVNPEREKVAPIKSTTVSVQVPAVDGATLTQVTVVGQSTKGTNGKVDELVVFDQNNWNIDQENGIINIKVENTANEDGKYFSAVGNDEYLITYIYEKDTEFAVEIPVSSDVKVVEELYTPVENPVKEVSGTAKATLAETTGKIVSYVVANLTEEMTKGYVYINYNAENKYEVPYASKTIINVSYKDIVNEVVVTDENTYYTDEAGNQYATDELYYKSMVISRENLVSILGEEGYINILDLSGNELAKIDAKSEADEAGNYTVTFNDKITKVQIRTSKPLAEGNLIIKNNKAITDSAYNKDAYKTFNSLVTTSKAQATYTYVNELVDCGNYEIKTVLNNTKTNAKLTMNQDTLSTVAMNSNVEMRIELGNADANSDVYGKSIFEIVMPKEVEEFNITNAEFIYNEGLTLEKVETYDRGDRKAARVTIGGKQNAVSSGTLTNGTNVVLYADIKVNILTPAKAETIQMYYYNEESTNYENKVEWAVGITPEGAQTQNGNGFNFKGFDYTAPTGLVTINGTRGYNNIGSVLTSVNQGKVEDKIEIFADAKIAEMEIIVMNNNKNTVSELTILGRIPFKGVKDLVSGADLNTTVDTVLKSGIEADAKNNVTAKIYYSANTEATRDLNNPDNGWVENPENLSEMKSYLIVPEEGYVMDPATILRYTYKYEIPANLEHNATIYGTFKADYKNNTEVATIEETSIADIVGLTTGEGPQMSLEVSNNATNAMVKEYGEVVITAKIKNTGKAQVNNAVVTIPAPAGTTYVSHEVVEGVTATYNESTEEVKYVIPVLLVDETKELKVTIKVGEKPSIETMYADVEGFSKTDDGRYVIMKPITDENGEVDYEETEIPADTKPAIEVKAYVTADGLAKTIESNIDKVEVTESALSVLIERQGDDDVMKPGKDSTYSIVVKNLTDVEQKNVKVTLQLPAEMTMTETYQVGFAQDGKGFSKIENGKFDEATRTLTWNLESIPVSSSKQFRLVVIANDFEEGKTFKKQELVVKAQAEGTEEYVSNALAVRFAKPSLEVVQSTFTTNTYVEQGDFIEYRFTIKNIGSAVAEDVVIRDEIPEGLIIKSLSYQIDGKHGSKKVANNDAAKLTATIPVDSTLIVDVVVLAKTLKGQAERSVTNKAVISGPDIKEKTSNEITHIIEASPEDVEQQYAPTGPVDTNKPSTSPDKNTNIVKTYKISGIAWLDENGNGMRESEEKRLNSVTASLVNTATGEIVKTAKTSTYGEYMFQGVNAGTYIIIYDYDTVEYRVTEYKTSGVEANVNSDVVSTKVEQNGRLRNAAVSDNITVSTVSISNVDIGLVYAETFDLSLTKSITKVSVQTKNGTENKNYEHKPLVKTEIAAKHVVGAVVYIEYTLTVKNEGEVAGYASKLIDYKPEGMEFNSALNKNWYSGNDGNLYTSELANTLINPGESKEVKLILTKQLTDNNTGIVNNRAEIAEDFNIYGISDKDSEPINQNQGEDDLGAADCVITIKTGESLIYVSVLITSLLAGAVIVFIVRAKIISSKRFKGGVL